MTGFGHTCIMYLPGNVSPGGSEECFGHTCLMYLPGNGLLHPQGGSVGFLVIHVLVLCILQVMYPQGGSDRFCVSSR